MSKPVKDPCKPYACRIEACLQRNSYQEPKCLYELEEMRQCCIKWQKESFVCCGIDIKKAYLKETQDKVVS